MSGFIQLKRTAKSIELMKDANAFLLLTQIAIRSKRTDSFSVQNIEKGRAMIGDFRNAGIKTYAQYRGAKSRLENSNLIATKTTNKGTLARLLTTDVYDINIDGQPPKEQDNDNPIATNNNDNNDNNNISKDIDESKSHGNQEINDIINLVKEKYKQGGLQYNNKSERMFAKHFLSNKFIQEVLDPYIQTTKYKNDNLSYLEKMEVFTLLATHKTVSGKPNWRYGKIDGMKALYQNKEKLVNNYMNLSSKQR